MLTICVCMYKKTKDSQWEEGAMINEDQQLLDKHGKPVEGEVWDHKNRHHTGCAVFNRIPCD